MTPNDHITGATRAPRPVPAGKREPGWVTKADLTRYLRCPYAFVQLACGAITPQDLLDDITVRLIDDGVRFEQDVVAGATPAPDGLDLADLFAGEHRVVGLPTLQHPALRLRGVPDAVVADRGGLLPIEIKSHKDLRRSDELELAFYWLLLDHHRTRNVNPRGFVILRRDGQPHEVEVAITDALLAEVTMLIAEVRRARRHGVKPRVCTCVACRGPLREMIERATRAGRDLTCIWGIGRKFARALEDHAVRDYAQLLDRDPVILAAMLRAAGWSISASMIVQWQQHARSYLDDRPVFFAPAIALDDYIALDLEYNPISTHIWLAGLHVVRGDRRDEHTLWADNPSEEAALLAEIGRLLATHSGLPVITWAGGGADVPTLRSAAARHAQPDIAAQIADRHVDAFRHAAVSWRVPIPAFSLSQIASYFAVPKTSKITDGLQAQFLYDRYLASNKPDERTKIRTSLVEYNRDDLLATSGVLQAVRTLAA